MPALHSQSADQNPTSSPAGTSAQGRALLRSSPLFSHLDDAEADAILADARVEHYPEGTQVFANGDPGDSMMAVLHGRVVISNPSPDGRPLVLTIFRDGDVFGEMALLDGKKRSADATASAECKLLVVPRRSLLRLLQQRPDVCIELMVVLCGRLRRTNEQVEDFAFLGLERRMAKLLLHLTQDASDRSAPRPELKISQRVLGELVGATRENINRQLHDWKRSGIIAVGNGSIQICDREALADLV
jgi:CRP/FNR family transcriptional regulator, cyclic AMP receptor protein